MKIELAEPLLPSSHAQLMADLRMTRERAFDVLARRAAAPTFQQMIREYESTPDGRKLLVQASAAWDAAGLPCPWDQILELRPRT